MFGANGACRWVDPHIGHITPLFHGDTHGPGAGLLCRHPVHLQLGIFVRLDVIDIGDVYHTRERVGVVGDIMHGIEDTAYTGPFRISKAASTGGEGHGHRVQVVVSAVDYIVELHLTILRDLESAHLGCSRLANGLGDGVITCKDLLEEVQGHTTISHRPFSSREAVILAATDGLLEMYAAVDIHAVLIIKHGRQLER